MAKEFRTEQKVTNSVLGMTLTINYQAITYLPMSQYLTILLKKSNSKNSKKSCHFDQ